MVKQKQITQNTEPPVVVEEQAANPPESSPFKTLSENLKNIRSLKGVMGYIIRNGASAVIDLQDTWPV